MVAVAQLGLGRIDKHLGAAAVGALAQHVALAAQGFVAVASGQGDELGGLETGGVGVLPGVAHGTVDFDVVHQRGIESADLESVARLHFGTGGFGHGHVDQAALAAGRTHQLHRDGIGVFGESAGVGDEVLHALARNHLIGHGAAYGALHFRAWAYRLDHQVVPVLGVDQGGGTGLGQVAVEVEGLHRFASAHHAHAAHGTEFGGSAGGRNEVEGAVGGGQRVGSGLLDFAGDVDRNAAGKVQGEVHLVAGQVKVGGQALVDGFVGLGKGHSGYVEAPQA